MEAEVRHEPESYTRRSVLGHPMSEEEDGGHIRTVTEPFHSRADEEMNIIGMLYGLGLIVVLIPLIPFIVLIWLMSKVNRALAGPSE